MALNNKTRSWTEYYDQESKNISMKKKDLKHFDLTTLGLTNNPAALVGTTSTYPNNWMFIAGTTSQGKVNNLHHAFSVVETTHDDPKIVEVTGNKMTSALKSFDPTTATKAVKPPVAVT
jgi:hypothetical protein